MTNTIKSLMRRSLLVTAALAAAVPASAARLVIREGFGFGAWGPYGYGYPYYWAPVTPAHPNAGQVKFDTKVKDANVYINGAFAGTVGDLKNMWLKSGNYDLEIRAPGGASFTEKVYVLAGKTVHVHPDLPAPARS